MVWGGVDAWDTCTGGMGEARTSLQTSTPLQTKLRSVWACSERPAITARQARCQAAWWGMVGDGTYASCSQLLYRLLLPAGSSAKLPQLPHGLQQIAEGSIHANMSAGQRLRLHLWLLHCAARNSSTTLGLGRGQVRAWGCAAL